MEDKTKNAIDAILNEFDAKQEASRQQAEKQKTEREMFLENFYGKSQSLIRPQFEEIGKSLKERGHDFEITENKEAFERDGKLKSRASIAISIFPNGVRPGYSNQNDCPRISFMAETYKSTVFAHECTMMPGRGGQAGSAGEYKLEEITPAIVDKHVLSVLSKAMVK